MQVAATEGRLELCRFLLQACSLFHRDDIINEARRRLYAYAANRAGKSRVIGLVEEVDHLLATEYGTSADDGLDYWIALGEFSDMYHDKDRPLLLPHISVADSPFLERFEIAIESICWHPEFFAASFRDDESAMLATQANEAGKTALHWALANYGEFTYVSESVSGSGLNDVVVTNGYAKLAVALIRKGSDVHSCWHRPAQFRSRLKASPLISLLQGMYGYRYWVAAELSDAVYAWGKILAAAGMSLQKYAATENLFLRANRASVKSLDGHELIVTGLEISGQDNLTIHVEPAYKVRVWKATPIQVPGEWPASPSSPSPVGRLPEIPDTIIWRPEEYDEREGFRWVVAGNVSITTSSYLVEPPGTIEDHELGSIDLSPPPRLHEYERPLYDDDFSVLTMKNDEGFRQRSHAHTRRRSASAPAVERRPKIGGHMLNFPEPWCGSIHRCAVDNRWKASSTTAPSLRDCMQGRCRDRTEMHPDDGYTWETELMTHEGFVEVAKRFARRFRPRYLDMVGMTSLRATERARLAMAPARPPARSW